MLLNNKTYIPKKLSKATQEMEFVRFTLGLILSIILVLHAFRDSSAHDDQQGRFIIKFIYNYYSLAYLTRCRKIRRKLIQYIYN